MALFQDLIQRLRGTFPWEMRVVCKGDQLPLLVLGLEMSGAVPLHPHHTPSQYFMAGTGTTLRYYQSIRGEGKRREEYRQF